MNASRLVREIWSNLYSSYESGNTNDPFQNRKCLKALLVFQFNEPQLRNEAIITNHSAAFHAELTPQFPVQYQENRKNINPFFYEGDIYYFC